MHEAGLREQARIEGPSNGLFDLNLPGAGLGSPLASISRKPSVDLVKADEAGCQAFEMGSVGDFL